MRPISVIICSLNPRPDYFRRVLDGLKAQTLSTQQWELLVVDNGSHRPLSESWDLSWHPHHAHIREDELGLTPARLRGIKEANGQRLVLVDDDNLIAPDYLERVVDIERLYPYLTVFGAGHLEPEFETEPRPEVRRLLALLGLRTVPRGLWSNNPRDSQCIPWGAGLCVSRSIATAYVTLVERLGIGHLLDRRGTRLFSGGDDLFSWVSARAGSGLGIFPSLRITHMVSSNRVAEDYLLRLVHDHAYSHGILKYVLCGDEQPRLHVADTIRILLHGLRRGRFSMRCNWAAARGADRAARDITAQNMHPIETGEFAY
jgi:hypothetical protein